MWRVRWRTWPTLLTAAGVSGTRSCQESSATWLQAGTPQSCSCHFSCRSVASACHCLAYSSKYRGYFLTLTLSMKGYNYSVWHAPSTSSISCAASCMNSRYTSSEPLTHHSCSSSGAALWTVRVHAPRCRAATTALGASAAPRAPTRSTRYWRRAWTCRRRARTPASYRTSSPSTRCLSIVFECSAVNSVEFETRT